MVYILQIVDIFGFWVGLRLALLPSWLLHLLDSTIFRSGGYCRWGKGMDLDSPGYGKVRYGEAIACGVMLMADLK